MKRGDFTMSPQQCQVLSVLTRSAGSDGLSCTTLSHIMGIGRPVLYVLVRRLAARKWVRRRVVTLRGPGRRDAPVTQVLYAITARGEKARAAYAFELGVWPP